MVSRTSKNVAFSGSCSGAALRQRVGLISSFPHVILLPMATSSLKTLPVVLLRPSSIAISSEPALAVGDKSNMADVKAYKVIFTVYWVRRCQKMVWEGSL